MSAEAVRVGHLQDGLRWHRVGWHRGFGRAKCGAHHFLGEPPTIEWHLRDLRPVGGVPVCQLCARCFPHGEQP